MKTDNTHVEVGPLFNHITLHIPDECLRDSFKTKEAQEAMYDQIVEKFMQFKNQIMIDMAEMQIREENNMAREKAERVSRQMAAYLDLGLSEEKAWELVKLEVTCDAQDT